MATAAMKSRARPVAYGDSAVAPEPVSMEFLIVEDNSGHYHWTLLRPDGSSLARSPDLASHQDAEDAARVVLNGIGSARLDRRGTIDGALVISDKTNVPTGENGDGVEGRVQGSDRGSK